MPRVPRAVARPTEPDTPSPPSTLDAAVTGASNFSAHQPPTSVKDHPLPTSAPNPPSTNRRPFARRVVARRSKPPTPKSSHSNPAGDAPPPPPLPSLSGINGGGEDHRSEQATPHLETPENASPTPSHDADIRAKPTSLACSMSESNVGASNEACRQSPDTAAVVPPVTCAETLKPTSLAFSESEFTVGPSDKAGPQNSSDTAVVPPVSCAEALTPGPTAAIAAGDGPPGWNTVVRRTVRVVKKVVKKKKLVKKKVPKSALEALARQSEKAEVTGGAENVNPRSSVLENQDESRSSSTVITSKQSEVSDALACVETTNPPGVTVSMNEVENLKSRATSPICPVLVKEAGDQDSSTNSASVKEVLGCAGIKEGEDPVSSVSANSIVSVPVEGLENSSVALSSEVEIPSSSITAPMETEKPDKSKCYDGLKDGSAVEIPSGGQGFNLGKAGIFGSCETLASDDKTVVDALNVDLTEQTEHLDSDDVEKSEAHDGSKGYGDMSSGCLTVLSEKMEALERRKRRKTEIFIGGLDKDAKEEDIRKVFEEVGNVVEVRLMMKGKTGQNKGYAFLRYASADDAKTALEKYSKVKICGRECGAALVEGNDTIFLGNIDKKWKNDDVLKLLQNIGIEKVDTVTVMMDPRNIECNRGYAFVELETSRDAQIAFKKLQKKEVFGKHVNITVAWAEPLIEPDEEEMLKVKTVYVEFIPTSWDECNVGDFFTKFGVVDNVVLARNLPSTKRKDFAFVNFKTREAAISCIESFSRDLLDVDGSEANMKVSIARPVRKGKQSKQASSSVMNKTPKEKSIVATQHVTKSHDLRNNGKFLASASSGYQVRNADRSSSTNAELLQLLREQSSRKPSETGLRLGPANHLYSPPGRKRPFSAVVDDPVYSDPRGYRHTRVERSYPAADQSYYPISSVGVASRPYYQHCVIDYRPGYGFPDYTSNSQREGAPNRGPGVLYRRYY